jgi:hypothetical protein
VVETVGFDKSNSAQGKIFELGIGEQATDDASKEVRFYLAMLE